MMVVKSLINPTVTSQADFVLVAVALKQTVLELKEPTAWPTKSALIAEAMQIA